MLSPDNAQRHAIRFFEYCIAQGIDMSTWTILRSHPTKVSPANLVLLAAHTAVEIGVLFKHGIGIDNRVRDLQQHIVIDSRGGMTVRDPAANAA